MAELSPEAQKEVQLYVAQLFREDAGKHREYLQEQLSHLKWAAVLIAGFLGVGIAYFAGRSYSDLKSVAESQLKTEDYPECNN